MTTGSEESATVAVESPEAGHPPTVIHVEAPPEIEETVVPATPLAPVAEPSSSSSWSRQDSGRWVVGDAGRQQAVSPRQPRAGLYGKIPPDCSIDGAAVENLAYRAASLRGFSHQENGIPRQDAYLVRVTANQKWLVGCVADGVGEGRLSHVAAELACERLTRIMADALKKIDPATVSGSWAEEMVNLPWQAAADAANEAILDKATQYFQDVYDRNGQGDPPQKPLPHSHAQTIMSTTAVLFLMCTEPDSDGGFLSAVANVAGDSSAFLLSNDREWIPLTAVKNEGTEVASTSVRPLPGHLEVRPRHGTMRPGSALVVVSDGVGDPLADGSGDVGAFLALMWNSPPDLLAFAQHVGFYRRSFADDRTAVVVWPRGPGQ